jgi:hypothetical protein
MLTSNCTQKMKFVVIAANCFLLLLFSSFIYVVLALCDKKLCLSHLIRVYGEMQPDLVLFTGRFHPPSLFTYLAFFYIFKCI